MGNGVNGHGERAWGGHGLMGACGEGMGSIWRVRGRALARSVECV
jgi:hypothetical protein